MLEVDGVRVGYERSAVLRDVSVRVAPQEYVAVLGANGAGKTTLLRSIMGLLEPWSGRIRIDGDDLTKARSQEVVRKGIVMVPEGRGIFYPLTVAENLELGFLVRPDRSAPGWEPLAEEVTEPFPVLRERWSQHAGTLSGGEQQMLAIARALMSRPTYLLLDEPSLGLAPQVLETITAALRNLRERNVSVLMVEQNTAFALKLVERAYVISLGEIALEDTSQFFHENPSRLEAAFLSDDEEE